MDQWKGKIGLITGATDDIGSAIIKQLLKYDIAVIGAGSNETKLKELAKELSEQGYKKFHYVLCDVRKESDIVSAFKWIHENVGLISILINSSEIFTKVSLLDVDSDIINQVFNINVAAPILLAKYVIKSLLENNMRGHIINMNSTAGNTVVCSEDVSAVYSASKNALKIVSEALRRELVKKTCNIKVTNLSPSFVDTDLIRHLEGSKLLPDDVANACIIILKTSPNVLIPQLTVTATNAEG